jgi:hypothetical protein
LGNGAKPAVLLEHEPAMVQRWGKAASLLEGSDLIFSYDRPTAGESR